MRRMLARASALEIVRGSGQTTIREPVSRGITFDGEGTRSMRRGTGRIRQFRVEQEKLNLPCTAI